MRPRTYSGVLRSMCNEFPGTDVSVFKPLPPLPEEPLETLVAPKPIDPPRPVDPPKPKEEPPKVPDPNTVAFEEYKTLLDTNRRLVMQTEALRMEITAIAE